VDASSSDLCGKCTEVYGFQAIVAEKKAAVYYFAKCMGCGACVTRRLMKATRLVRAESRGIPLDVIMIVRKVEQTTKTKDGRCLGMETAVHHR
jgi:MinD superfamily P-loop ATPase